MPMNTSPVAARDEVEEERPGDATPCRQAVILAAGGGVRFGEITNSRPKPLLELAGVPLIMRTIHTARKAGIEDFTVVTGYHGDLLEQHLERQHIPGVRIRCVRNEEWQRPNGVSAFKARDYVQGPFLLLMSDHLFEADLVKVLLASPLAPGRCRLAVDSRVREVFDIDDATKVFSVDGLVRDIGKEIGTYNAIDTGVFLCSNGLFEALEKAFARGRESLSDGIHELAAEERMEAADIGRSFWQDVDNERDLKEGERRLLASLVSSTDSWLTQKINRRISLAVTRRLAPTRITPNQITLFNFMVGLAGALAMAAGSYWAALAGAVLFLASSILDGCDGEIARLKFQQSHLGAWLDVVTDNIVHLVLFGCLTAGVVKATGSWLYWLPGGLLVAGSLTSFILSLTARSREEGKAGLVFSENRLQDVSAAAQRSSLASWLDRAANRDFAYLILALALVDRLSWFLLIAGIGAPLFAFLLYRAMTPVARRSS